MLLVRIIAPLILISEIKDKVVLSVQQVLFWTRQLKVVLMGVLLDLEILLVDVTNARVLDVLTYSKMYSV